MKPRYLLLASALVLCAEIALIILITNRFFGHGDTQFINFIRLVGGAAILQAAFIVIAGVAAFVNRDYRIAAVLVGIAGLTGIGVFMYVLKWGAPSCLYCS